MADARDRYKWAPGDIEITKAVSPPDLAGTPPDLAALRARVHEVAP